MTEPDVGLVVAPVMALPPLPVPVPLPVESKPSVDERAVVSLAQAPNMSAPSAAVKSQALFHRYIWKVGLFTNLQATAIAKRATDQRYQRRIFCSDFNSRARPIERRRLLQLMTSRGK